MKLIKNIFSLTVIYFMVFILIPTMAFADDWDGEYHYYDITVCGVEISSDNCNDVLGDGTVSYNPNQKILYLNNFNKKYHPTNDYYGRGIESYSGNDITISVKGSNSLETTKECVYSEGRVTFVCDEKDSINDSLKLKSSNQAAIYVLRINVVSPIELTAEGGKSVSEIGREFSYGIEIMRTTPKDGNNLITNGARVTAVGGKASHMSAGIADDFASFQGYIGDFIVSNGAVVNAIGGDVDSKDSKHTMGNGGFSSGFRGDSDVYVKDGGKMFCTAGEVKALMSAESIGLDAVDRVYVHKGTLVCKGKDAKSNKWDAVSAGICSPWVIKIDGKESILDCKACRASGIDEICISCGVIAANLKAFDGKVTSKGDTAKIMSKKVDIFGSYGMSNCNVSDSKICVYLAGNADVKASGKTKAIFGKVRNAYVTKLNATKNGEKVKLSWNEINEAKKYKIYYKAGGNNYRLLGTTSRSSFTTKGLSKGRTYTFKIVSVSNGRFNGKKPSTSASAAGKTVKVKM